MRARGNAVIPSIRINVRCFHLDCSGPVATVQRRSVKCPFIERMFPGMYRSAVLEASAWNVVRFQGSSSSIGLVGCVATLPARAEIEIWVAAVELRCSRQGVKGCDAFVSGARICASVVPALAEMSA